MTVPKSYHSIVLVKQVPDTRSVSGEVMSKDGTMNRSAAAGDFQPGGSCNALEMALQLKAQHGGTVTVLTMGPLQAAEVLRQSLYRGADRVILVSDRKFAGADTQATSYTSEAAPSKKPVSSTWFSAGARRSMEIPPRWGRRWQRNWESLRSPMPKRSTAWKGSRSSSGERSNGGRRWSSASCPAC